ncbi:hypothetical protein RD110_26445 [Rhodoferax koreense]|uniref:Uncharacterized protein n=1 Tax=Rhodoferax koreensis TaxID=1842727 RepID=A0A1P8K2S6_9BURK|nr:hypothetical protein [Rhodoferax koreense]APW40303.1 hypothetical protein RD110_26445 [Rhodoferax koreense]
MNRLQTELHRLYLVDQAVGAGTKGEPGVVDENGQVRALVLELARPADWRVLALLWHGVQDDLALPAPAIVANGVDGYQLWFSLAEPVPAGDAALFLDRLRLRYLVDVAAARVTLQPASEMPPAPKAGGGQWSAFIARDLAAVFADEPWLDACPSPEAQADVLSRLKSIKPGEFRAALALLAPIGSTVTPHPTPQTPSAGQDGRVATSPAGPSAPKQFLLDVMADPSVDLHLRIEAARALLPYFEKPRGA